MIFSMQFSLLQNNLSSLLLFVYYHPVTLLFLVRHLKKILITLVDISTNNKSTRGKTKKQKKNRIFMLQAQVCFWFVPIISDGSSFQKCQQHYNLLVWEPKFSFRWFVKKMRVDFIFILFIKKNQSSLEKNGGKVYYILFIVYSLKLKKKKKRTIF